MNGVYSFCLDCGPNVRVDEDGCCVTCGRDAVGPGLKALNATANKLARAQAMEAALRAALLSTRAREVDGEPCWCHISPYVSSAGKHAMHCLAKRTNLAVDADDGALRTLMRRAVCAAWGRPGDMRAAAVVDGILKEKP